MIERVKTGPGRPRKYGRASRAVTLTLPEDVLARLAVVDTDIGRAIVTLAERNGKAPSRPPRRVEVAAYGSRAVVLVSPARVLKRLPGVQLVPVGNGRALISLEPSQSISQFELNVRDALERGDVTDAERQTLQAIGNILGQARRSSRVSAQPRTIIVLEPRRRNGPPG
jgi:hypothetical protein